MSHRVALPSGVSTSELTVFINLYMFDFLSSTVVKVRLYILLFYQFSLFFKYFSTFFKVFLKLWYSL